MAYVHSTCEGGMRRVLIAALAAAGTTLAGGCSGTLDDVLPDREPSYKSSTSTAPLEVPPDLASSALHDTLPVSESSTSYSQLAEGTRTRARVLPETFEAKIERDGQARWLVVADAPEFTWPKLRDFWISEGFSLKTQDPEIGVMETDWAEKHVPLPAGLLKGLANQISDALYGVTYRDQYRTRMERGVQSGTTEVYITHRGAEQMVVNDNTPFAKREGLGERVWQIRPSNPELEAEMLVRLMVFLGVEESPAVEPTAEGASSEPRATIAQDADGLVMVSLGESFSPAWRRVGLALDRGGFVVEDRDRSRGVFFVRYTTSDSLADGGKKGLLSRLKFWSDDDADSEGIGTYQIRLADDKSETTRIVVLDSEGKPEAGPAGKRILSILHELLE